MSYKGRGPDRDWTVVEVLDRGRGVCTTEWYNDERDQDVGNVVDDEVLDMLAQLRLLIAAGDPADTERGNPKIQKVGVHEFRHDGKRYRVPIKVLKGKPGHWRTYLIIPDHARAEFVLLHTVIKNTDGRDPNDFKHCCTVTEKFYAGKLSTRPVVVPSR